MDSDFDPSLTADAYRAILELGLENLQRAALPELHPYLRIEIDHLHNIPKYISGTSLVGHGYYYCNERPFYLERVADTPIIDVDFMLSRYQPHWDALRDALSPYADAINSLNWNTKTVVRRSHNMVFTLRPFGHTFAVLQRSLALVQSSVVQASFASFRAVS